MSYRRKKEDKRRLNKIYTTAGNAWFIGAYYSDKKDRIIRIYQGKMAKYFRKYTNKKVRKEKDLAQHGKYRRVFDYWWNLW